MALLDATEEYPLLLSIGRAQARAFYSKADLRRLRALETSLVLDPIDRRALRFLTGP